MTSSALMMKVMLLLMIINLIKPAVSEGIKLLKDPQKYSRYSFWLITTIKVLWYRL
jgi:hypothetical protein